MERRSITPALMSTHPVCRTTQPDEAAEAVARYLTLHDLVRLDDDFSLVHNALGVGNVVMHYLDYGGAVEVRPSTSSRSFYLVQVPLEGHMSIDMPHHSSLSIGAGGAVGSIVGYADSPMRYLGGCPRLLVQVPLHVLRQGQQRIAPGTTPAPMSPMSFIDVSSGAGFSWLKLLLWILTDVDSPGGMVGRTSGANYLEQLIVDGLLLTLSDQQVEAAPSSKSVRLAVEYMRANMRGTITPSDIAGAAYVSVRALHEGFRKHVGTTPMAYLRELRMEAVHHALTSARPGEANVSEIAHSWGVTHLGRFAAEYRDRFGATPSATLRTRCVA